MLQQERHPNLTRYMILCYARDMIMLQQEFKLILMLQWEFSDDY